MTYADILSRRYSIYEWAMSGSGYVDLEWLDPSPKPTVGDLDALWDSVQTEINLESDTELKVDEFQKANPIQDQLITIMRGVVSGDSTDITNLLTEWDNL